MAAFEALLAGADEDYRLAQGPAFVLAAATSPEEEEREEAPALYSASLNIS